MTLKFRIEQVLNSQPTPVIARQLQRQNFSVGNSSTLGACRVIKNLNQPRVIKRDGAPDLDVFVFYLADDNDRKKLFVGAEVEFLP
jgi:hypothetical protein